MTSGQNTSDFAIFAGLWRENASLPIRTAKTASTRCAGFLGDFRCMPNARFEGGASWPADVRVDRRPIR